MAKNKPKVYSGDLAKPIPYNSIVAEALRTWRVTGGAPDESAITKWLAVEKTRRISLLLRHYEIEADSPDRWHMLARALADEHVPGFRLASKDERRVGRPRTRPTNALRKLLASYGKSKTGPKPLYSDEEIEFFREHIPMVQAELKKEGKRPSKRAAIHWLLEIYAQIRDKKMSRPRARAIADSHAKTVYNRIIKTSRVSG